MAVPQKHPEYTRERIRQLGQRLQKKIYQEILEPDEMLISEAVDRIPHAEGIDLPMKPALIGMSLDPLWATHWLKVQFTMPDAWEGKEVHLLFDSVSEAMVWNDGQPVQGLSARMWGQYREEWPLTRQATAGAEHTFFIEQASNSLFGERKVEESPHDHWLRRCEFGLFNPMAFELFHDLNILQQLEECLAATSSAWAKHLHFELNRFCNLLDETDEASWKNAGKVLKGLLSQKNGTFAHEMSAIGHAHLDTAWLWPLAETHRKLMRTTANNLALMEEYPEYKFSCSQAYQYEVLEREQPELFASVKEKVNTDQWIPVGGTWIEPDCNLPSGEALCRQFLFGQRYFEKHFGRRCTEFWNPDVFGYNGQLPQIIKQAGISRFLTQKLSWNKFNQPLHHSFWWKAIDGTAVLAHFPPVDTYNGVCEIKELLKHETNYKDSDRSKNAYYLFGFGDGGGGPTRTMLESLRRTADLQGVPRCTIRSSEDFFERLEDESDAFCTVTGELYLEVHRGTYTTQARTKLGNRRGEFWLHDLEFLGALAIATGKGSFPKNEVDELWKLLLLNQFHDILPGSSIALVYEDTERDYARIEEDSTQLREDLLSRLVTQPDGSSPLNTLGVSRTEVVESNGQLTLVECPMYGFGRYTENTDPVLSREEGDALVLENATLRALIGKDGTILQVTHKPTGRESLSQPGNAFMLYDDRPTNYEAWDVDPFMFEKVLEQPQATRWEWKQQNPLSAELEFTAQTKGSSTINWTIRLDAHGQRLEIHCDVDWQESCKMLKVAFPMNVLADEATYEMQFGAVRRPTHMNDSIALAKYEVPGHRWADLSETGFGVSLLSDCKYGFSARESTLCLSLLRSTNSPDPNADIGKQTFAYALYPHAGDWKRAETVEEGLRFNWPVIVTPGKHDPGSFFSLDDCSLILDTVKPAEDGKGMVLRLYESRGGSGTAELSSILPFAKAEKTNIMEDSGEDIEVNNKGLQVDYRPWEILSIRLC